MKRVFSLIGAAFIAGAMLFTSCGGEKYTITAEANDATMGTVTGGGEYALDATVVLTATPNNGFEFVSWNDGNTENPRTITVTADASYVAVFQPVMTNGIKVAFDGTEWTAAGQNAAFYSSASAYDVYAWKVSSSELPIADVASYATTVGTASDTYTTSGWTNNKFAYIEYYKDGSVTDGTYNYGDWWAESATINVTAFDATALTVSAKVDAVMFDALEALGSESGVGIDGATKAPMTVNIANVSMEASKAPMKKYNGKKLLAK